jgi:hypothetical protein
MRVMLGRSLWRCPVIWLELALAALGPVAVIWVAFNLNTIIDAVAGFWRSMVRRVRRQPEGELAPMSVEKIAADLRRINAYLDSIERSDAPARAARLKAAVLAYDDVLLLACRTLEIPAPERAPLESVDRLETEAALAQHGLVW